MSIKDKQRSRKIRKFIEKNRDLNFREDQLNVLYTIKSEDFISALNKMSKEKKEYVLEPLKYVLEKDRKKDNIDELDPTELYKVMKNQLNIATQEDFDLSTAPNLMKLYIAEGKFHDILYNHLYTHYINRNIVEDPTDYINAFTKNFTKWKEIFSTHTLHPPECSKLQNIEAPILVQLARYECEVEEERKFFVLLSLIEITKKEQEKINNIDPVSFSKLLAFILKKDLTTTKDLKLLITTLVGYNYSFYVEYDIDSQKLEVLEKLPSYIFDYLKKDVAKNLDIINSLYENKQVVEEIIKIDEISRYEVIKIIESENFTQLSPKSKTIILQKLRIDGATSIEQFLMYKKGVEFLIGIEEEEGFLDKLPETYIMPALDFICKLDHNHPPEDQIQILEEKFKALNRIKDELVDDEEHLNLFNRYIEFLSHELDNKKPTDQVKQLQSRSTYFEKVHFENVVKKMEQLPDQEEITKLLYSNKSPEEMEEYYHFVNIANKYSKKTLKKIVKCLRHIQTAENARKIIEYIGTEQFIEANPKTQRKLLKSELTLGDKKKIKTSDITINIEDYHYVVDVISQNGEEMPFINPETGTKVMIKRKNQKK